MVVWSKRKNTGKKKWGKSKGLVYHNQYGKGKKLYERNGGFELAVDFEIYGRRTVLSKDCSEIKDGKLSSNEKINEKIPKICDFCKELPNGRRKNDILKKFSLDEDTFELILPKILRVENFKKIIPFEEPVNFIIKNVNDKSQDVSCKRKLEAFRLGVAPGFAVSDITVGREKELEIINSWINEDSGSLMAIGQYGQGKSHMIRYVREKSLKEGYIVADCIIGKESQMNKPKTVLNTLIRNLTYRLEERDGNIEDLFLQYAYAMKDRPQNFLYHNVHLGKFTTNLIRKVRNDIPPENSEFGQFIDYLKGDATVKRFERIPDYATSANIVCNILSAIGNMINAIGMKGLLLIFDEGEDINNNYHQINRRRMGKNFLYGITKMANNDTDLIDEDLEQNYDGKYVGRFSELIYSGIKKVKFSDFKHSHVKCLFAFVEGEDEIIDELARDKTKKIELPEFSEREKKLLVNKIAEIHQECYNYEIEDLKKLQKYIFKKLSVGGNTRSVIKVTAEALDLTHYNLGVPYEKILGESSY